MNEVVQIITLPRVAMRSVHIQHVVNFSVRVKGTIRGSIARGLCDFAKSGQPMMQRLQLVIGSRRDSLVLGSHFGRAYNLVGVSLV